MSKAYILCSCKRADAQVYFGGEEICQTCLSEREREIRAAIVEKDSEIADLKEELRLSELPSSMELELCRECERAHGMTVHKLEVENERLRREGKSGYFR